MWGIRGPWRRVDDARGETSRAAQQHNYYALADALPSSITAVGIAEDRKGWLFRTSHGNTAAMLTEHPMIPPDARPRSASTPWTPTFLRRSATIQSAKLESPLITTTAVRWCTSRK